TLDALAADAEISGDFPTKAERIRIGANADDAMPPEDTAENLDTEFDGIGDDQDDLAPGTISRDGLRIASENGGVRPCEVIPMNPLCRGFGGRRQTGGKDDDVRDHVLRRVREINLRS